MLVVVDCVLTFVDGAKDVADVIELLVAVCVLEAVDDRGVKEIRLLVTD